MLAKIVIFSLMCLSGGECAKILGLSNLPTTSHYILYDSLFAALAARGHEVTVVAPYSSTQVGHNLEYIELEEAGLDKTKGFARFASTKKKTWYNYHRILTMDHFHDLSAATLKGKTIKNLLRSNRKFDLMILDYYTNDAFIGLAWHYRCPVVLLSTTSGHPLMNQLLYNPSPYSYVPDAFRAYSAAMTFYQRVRNTVDSIFFEIVHNLYHIPKQERLLHQVFPEAPRLTALLGNISLVLVNSHHSIESPRPYVPGVVQIGGFHAEAPRKLENDTRQFLDAADEGAIFVSLGSVIKSLPNDTFRLFIDTFSSLPWRVLWKFDTPDFTSVPPNVFLKSWVSQRDVLAHRNVKLFITHGGLGSMTEAIYHAVPMVGIPFFADQECNIAEAVNNEYAYLLPFAAISKESLMKAIVTVLEDHRYTKNVEMRSAVLRDQPLKPMDNAIYWVEYVMRHGGAHHLKTQAMKLPWYQYYLVDVVGFLVVIMFTFVALITYVIKTGLYVLPQCLPPTKMQKVIIVSAVLAASYGLGPLINNK